MKIWTLFNLSERKRLPIHRPMRGRPSPASPPATMNEKPVRQVRGFRWLIIYFAIYTTCFLYGLDTTIAADVQGPVVEAFGHVEQLTWLGAGFPLGSVVAVLPVGALYNMFNTRWIFIVSVILFEVGSALCGGAPSKFFLIRSNSCSSEYSANAFTPRYIPAQRDPSRPISARFSPEIGVTLILPNAVN